ncbi:MAG TPA: zinc ABC transporter substrate-binding protein [Micropepsaceae bacterium]|nr:zinc ABC transporter substrate-binding protein [Micropepsaceae bacterium]
MRKSIIAALLLASGAASPAYANLNVFACEPEWAALATEIGGDKVSVYSATTGGQDPHQVQARPSLIAKARSADISVCTGAELEIGWLPAIIQQSASQKIRPGAPGAFEASSFVNLLEVPSRLDRAEGDIHAAGNPHIQTNPNNILAVAKPLAARFAELDPANAQTYSARLADFTTRWQAAMAKWQTQAAPLKGVPIAVEHQSWIYLENWLGLKRVIALEPKPGVPPSAGYLAQVVDTLQKTPAKMVIRAAYEDERPSLFISDKAHIPSVTLPYTVGGTDGAKNLFSLYDDTLNRLLAAAKG